MKHESLGGLQPSISFQFGLGKVSKALPPLSTTEKSIPRRNVAASSFISSFASRWPRQVVLPTEINDSVSRRLDRERQEGRTSTPTNVRVLRIRAWTAWIEFPWIRVQLLIQMDVAERINDVMSRRNELPVDVYIRPHVLSHGGVRLCQPGCLVYQCIKDGRGTFPCIQWDLCECDRELREGSASLVRRQRMCEHERLNLRVGLRLPLGVCAKIS